MLDETVGGRQLFSAHNIVSVMKEREVTVAVPFFTILARDIVCVRKLIEHTILRDRFYGAATL